MVSASDTGDLLLDIGRCPARRVPVRARKTSSSVAPWIANAATAVRSGSTLVEQRAHVRGAAVGGDAERQAARVAVDARARRAWRSAACVGAPRRQRQVQPLAGDPPLELGGGALGDDAAAVDDGDAVGQPVGLLEVLGGEEDRHAAGRRARAITSHIACRLRGSRPVVGSSRKSTTGRADEAGGEVEPAAHAAGVGRHPPPAGVDEVEAVQQLGGPARGPPRADRPRSRPIMRRFSSPVCSSSSAAYWPVRLIARRTRAALGDDVVAGDARPPAVRRGERAEDPHGRRLARAVGPEQREHAAARGRAGRRRAAPSRRRRTSRGRPPRPRSRRSCVVCSSSSVAVRIGFLRMPYALLRKVYAIWTDRVKSQRDRGDGRPRRRRADRRHGGGVGRARPGRPRARSPA